jgi:hypothetical protein
MTRRRLRLAGALFGLLVVLSMLVVIGTPAPSRADGSAVTVSGTGEFASLKVSVNQTTNLINQVITVTWTGGKPTLPVSGDIASNYLQLMQCAGDADGPTREQCQFGALFTDARGGQFTNKRQVAYGTSLVDPLETYLPTPADPRRIVPFRAVNGVEVTGSILDNQFFSSNTTNEIPYARTRTDGTGEAFFEIQTAVEAPGIGCGDVLTDTGGATSVRPCWLVVVPRGSTEVNGTPAASTNEGKLISSPLSATNWAKRIAVKLTFQPVGRACPIGARERLTAGNELITEAMSRWQPTLCAGGGTVFGFSQVADLTARRQVTRPDNTSMVFVSSPVPAAEVPPTKPLVYAPVALSGLAIALNIERQTPADAPPEAKRNDGQRIVDLKLTPRLVAKLITQSYRAGVAYSADYLKNNPGTLTEDKEFLDLNPGFKDQLNLPIGDILLPQGQLDAIDLLWRWIDADPDARAFLAGTPDPNGMIVNPTYKGLAPPIDQFPKSDLFCEDLGGDAGVPPLCTPDSHPYASDMHEGVRSAARGDTLSRNVYNTNPLPGEPVSWKKGPPQPPGQRAVLSITDPATAERFGLPMARLRNRAGAFVAPTAEALSAATTEMKAGAVTGVLEPNPTPTAAAAYPLAQLTYAAIPPAGIDANAGKDYANLLRYIAGPGQTPGVAYGELPFGYAPLPWPLREQAFAAAQKVADLAGKAIVIADDGGAAPGTGTGGVTGTGSPTPAPTPTAAPAGGATPAPVGVKSPAPSPSPSPAPAAQAGTTPAQPVGPVRYALVVIFILGGLTAGTGPVLLGVARSGREVVTP